MVKSIVKSRLSYTFAKSRQEKRAALVGYVMAGDPNLESSLEAMHDMVASGVDILELGFPFTDPMADGPIIQRASLRALANDTTLSDVFTLLRRFRDVDSDTPVILMGYANPVHNIGYEAFAEKLLVSGGDGVIVVDIPLEESAPLHNALGAKGLDLIRLAAPTSNPQRLSEIAKGASGFIYFVSVAGVTGDKSADLSGLSAQIEHLRFISGAPVCVGFGIKSPRDVNNASQIADGVVVGSGIVRFAEKMAEDDADYDDIRAFRNDYVRQLAEGLKIN